LTQPDAGLTSGSGTQTIVMKTVARLLLPLFAAATWASLARGAEPLAAQASREPEPAAPRVLDAAQDLRPRLGLWYTVWWTQDDQFRHWTNCHRLPTRGRYSAGDPEIITAHYAQFRELGVDFLILDDTNCAGVDGGRINDNIRAWFDFMDALPVSARIPICIGGGGEMRASGKAAQQRAADFYWTQWAQRPSYFRLQGKPLLLADTDKNYGPGDFDDARFTVRWAYNGDNHAAMKQRKTWGWGAYAPAPVLEECMSIWPGHRFPRNVAQLGNDPLEAPREGGELYVREWLRVLKSHPQFVTIADWNNFEEETAIEDSYAWEDRWGHAVPDLYRRITRAYSRLRVALAVTAARRTTPGGREEDSLALGAKALVKGEYYRSERGSEVYLFDGEHLVYMAAMPRRAAIIQVPDEIFGWLRRACA
jgi:hypothetical protein